MLKRFNDEWHLKVNKAKDEADIREFEDQHAKEYKELMDEMRMR